MQSAGLVGAGRGGNHAARSALPEPDWEAILPDDDETFPEPDDFWIEDDDTDEW